MAPVSVSTSAGRFPDGNDSDSNCTDFLTQAAATLSANSAVGATNIKVASTEGFRPGQTIHLDSDANVETAVIATVGTPGATTISSSIDEKATVLPVASVTGFSRGQTITIGDGEDSETAIISAVRTHGDMTITGSPRHMQAACRSSTTFRLPAPQTNIRPKVIKRSGPTTTSVTALCVTA
jgi:hypothetical protein